MTLPAPIVSAKGVLTRYLNQLVPLLDEASETFGKPFEFPEEDGAHKVYVKTVSARLLTLDSDIHDLLAKLISKNAVMYTYLNTAEYAEFYTDI
ncbi:hypothetical protein PRIPAC_79961 [Pristionchus pacificus]|uniref:Uncharacterized protein n=1 Tax=Pristionchus pacificus TaxID=54126 RepID=A0A2A6CLJ8_PRIPA|nr:hypothetical protein PRIPAC_79961 [Pristionchus pacificus]|eukprot:PDM78996.1 hypothetical protein PRIPAC_31575 [Pristionchus pacificus]